MPAEKKEGHGGEVEYVWKQGTESAEEIPSKILLLTILFLCRQWFSAQEKGGPVACFPRREGMFSIIRKHLRLFLLKSLVRRERAAYRENLSELAEISANIKA